MSRNWNNPDNFVHAYNSLSCTVACVLSICYDNGILKKKTFTDEIIVKDPKYWKLFPHWDPNHWDKKPGVLNNADTIKLGEALNLVSVGNGKLIENVTLDDIKKYFESESTIGILILTHKDQNGNPSNHCFKLSDQKGNDYFLMNPSTNEADQVKKFTGEEIILFAPDCIIFSR